MKPYRQTRRRHLTVFLLVGVAWVLAGCSTGATLELVDFKTGERVDAFIDPLKKEVRAYMPNGDVLTGPYSANSTATFTFGGGARVGTGGLGAGVGPGISSAGDERIYAYLGMPGSPLLMEIIAKRNTLTGGGFGEARTNDGRTYKVIFK